MPRYSHAYVSTIESGRRVPTPHALEYFAEKLGVDPEMLLTGRPPDIAAQLQLLLDEARIEISAGEIRQAEEEIFKVIMDARRYDLPRLEAAAEEMRGRSFEQKGDLDGAIDHYDLAINLLRAEPLTDRVNAVCGKARCLSQRGDKRYAIHLLEILLQSLSRSGFPDPTALLRIHSALITPYYLTGLFAHAKASADEARRYAADVTDPMLLGAMHVQVARTFLHEGRAEDAQASLNKAEDLFDQASLRTEAGMAHLAHAYVSLRGHEHDEARRQLGQAINIFHSAGRPVDEARSLNELARLEREQGDTGQAITLLHRSIDLLRESDVAELGLAHRELGLCSITSDHGTAEKNFRIAIELYGLAEERVEAAITCGYLGDLLHEQGQSDAGWEACRQGFRFLEKTF
jgi:tetratricopeptide (TPR) repeat protein